MKYDPLRDPLVTRKVVLTLIVIAVIGGGVGLSVDSGIVRRWWPEREAESTRLERDGSLRPAKNLVAANMDIVGAWVLNGLNYIHLSITPLAGDKYRIEVVTEGCIGPAKSIERTATFHDGVIKTDSPISEYAPYEYDTIYAVRVGGRDCLVPAAKVQTFNEAVGRDPKNAKFAPFYYSLTRDQQN